MKNKIVTTIILLSIIILFAILLLTKTSITGNIINLENADTQEQIILPIKVHIILDSSNQYSSTKNGQERLDSINGANYIWSQAKIVFQLKEITITEISSEAIPKAINSNPQELKDNPNFEDKKINLFLVQNLQGLNGLAIPEINSILVSDYTTVSNSRTTAHELGHILNLKHVNPESSLMARGQYGEKLSKEEIIQARNKAKKLIKDFS
ncbi:hypothetical protein COU54_00015 [Candidatus Pacearchaeota archaeon CG10_big_fil_rev_8_21_14_0_10_31_24]|nr:MAG: hypothetical protein COU54_00015 [Candidatus Pacearchaeota archaeon CG10_big_fil_rev_8_21_14_0_10_31_24]